jgi:hypothetical protein
MQLFRSAGALPSFCLYIPEELKATMLFATVGEAEEKQKIPPALYVAAALFPVIVLLTTLPDEDAHWIAPQKNPLLPATMLLAITGEAE